MGLKTISFTIILGILLSYAYLVIHKVLFSVPPLPDLGKEQWWGLENPGQNDETIIEPFVINVSDTVIQDLRNRLENTLPFQPSLEGVQEQYGMHSKHLNDILNFWKNKYDWRKRERILNKYPQFVIKVQGLKIHYLRVKPKETKGLKVLPLLMLHGWPSSSREFFDVIPILTTPRKGEKFVFEVIVASLPGFGFSEAPVRPGLNPKNIAVIFKNVMTGLGFEKYYIHGGDWGGQVVQIMATLFPERILGVHSNNCYINTPLSLFKTFLGAYWPSLIDSKENQLRMYPSLEKYMWVIEETGYLHIQATKPDTIGVALRESPMGLAAYMLEKYSVFTNPKWKYLEDGGLTQKFRMEDMMDNVMIYWITGCITTSMRIYAEGINKEYAGLRLGSIPTHVPSGCALFSNEIILQPPTVLKDKYVNLIHVADYEGGHFAPAEEPEAVANDIFIFVGKAEQLQNAKNI